MIATVFLYLSRKQTATVFHFPELLYFQEDVLAQGPSTQLKLEYLLHRNPQESLCTGKERGEHRYKVCSEVCLCHFDYYNGDKIELSGQSDKNHTHDF